MIVSSGRLLNHNFLSSAWQFITGRQFREVVVAIDVDFVGVVTNQTPQVFEARPPMNIIVCSLSSKLRDGMIVHRQLGTQVIRISDVEQPSITLLDCHAAVPEGVAEQWDQKHLGLEPQIHRSSFQPEPLTGRGWIRLPIGAAGKLRRDVSKMPTRQMRASLFRHMHLGIGKIGEATGVVGIAVSEDDVPHIGGRKSECFDPANGRVRFVEPKARHIDECLPQPLCGVLYILEADAGIDQCELLPILEKQAVADDRRVRRNQERSAVDVVNRCHKLSSQAFNIAASGSGSASR